VGRLRGRRQDNIWRNDLDMELEGDNKEERMLEEINWRGRGPKMCRSTTAEGEG
jgi:hypothetical protein